MPGVTGGPPSIGPIGASGPAGNGGDGGGIYNSGEMTIRFSAIYDNVTGNGGDGAATGVGGAAGSGGYGAGIFSGGKLNLNTCTVCSNVCGNGGNGAGPDQGSDGGAGGSGGGIFNEGSLKLTSCTVAMNQTGFGGNAGDSINIGSVTVASGGSGGSGGGLANNAVGTNVFIRNSLVAENSVSPGGNGGEFLYGEPSQQIGDSGANGIGDDVAGEFTSGGFNLVGTGDGSVGFTNGIDADQVGSDLNRTDPLLEPLKMNGGFTPTLKLIWGSPAIDQGNCFGNHADQRGLHRPRVYKFLAKPPGGDGSDIGAFELQAAHPQ